jgi:predicted PurR-regulated permease PerM
MMLRQQFIFWSIAIVVFIGLVILLQPILLPFVTGAIIAYLLDPLVDRIEKKGLSRLSGTAVVLLAFLMVFAGLMMLILPLLKDQLMGLVEAAPRYIEQIKNYSMNLYDVLQSRLQGQLDASAIKDNASTYAADALGKTTDIVGKILSSSFAIFDIISFLIVAPVVAFYMLKDWDKAIATLDQLLPRAHAVVIRDLLAQMNQNVAGFLRGQATVCVLLGLFYGLALSIAGVHFGLLIGLIAGILSFIPYVGTLTGFVAAMIVAYFQYDGALTELIWVVVIFVVGQIIEGNFLTPKLVGDKIGLHPVWVIFALMAGAHLMGFVGIMIAVPLAAIIAVMVRFLIMRYKASHYYHGGLDG